MAIMDLDGDGDVSPFGDGLMLVKYALGQRGTDLTVDGDLIGVGATRTTPAQIVGYIETIWWSLDVGGDGQTTFLDCIMILLYLIGLRDNNLVTGKISGADIRREADEIEVYIAKLVT